MTSFSRTSLAYAAMLAVGIALGLVGSLAHATLTEHGRRLAHDGLIFRECMERADRANDERARYQCHLLRHRMEATQR